MMELIGRYSLSMDTPPAQIDQELRLDDLLTLVEGNDSLLKAAVDRLRAEENGDALNWFKHGQHGSHNSYAD